MNDVLDPEWADLIADVPPLEVKQKKAPEIGPKPLTPGQKHMIAIPDMADGQSKGIENYLSLSETSVTILTPETVTEYRENGVQDQDFNKLKSSGFKTESELDLHGRSVAEAREKVWNFIGEAVRQRYRTVRIVHGRGVRIDPPARLKSFVAHWMIELPSVIAACTPAKSEGGTGALLVRVRRSRRGKQTPER